jgi:hypothetical protein
MRRPFEREFEVGEDVSVRVADKSRSVPNGDRCGGRFMTKEFRWAAESYS